MTEAVIPSVQTHSTPTRLAGQSAVPIRVDTEGRRSRFQSPPPPPGASPSLLLPTPGRVADNAALFGDLSQEDITIDTLGTSILPILPPVFQREGSSSVDDNRGTGDKVTRLYRWHLKFVRSTTNPSSDINLTHWVVAVGMPKKEAGANSIKTQSWRSSLMHKRRTTTSFETSSGSVYELLGHCNLKATARKTSTEFAAKFRDGLPEAWVDIVAEEARRLQYVRLDDKAGGIVPYWPSDDDAPVQKLVRKRKATASPGLEIVSLTRRASDVNFPASPDQASKKPRNSQKSLRSSASTPKGISRELRQLQTSTLGKLALVEAAILEGLDTPQRRPGSEVEKAKTKGGPQPYQNTMSEHEEKVVRADIRQTAKTPLRSSGRARNGVREWWKVSSESDKKKAIQARPSVEDLSPKSTGTHLGLATDASDSDEEYKCATSSEDEDTSKEVDVKAVSKKYARKVRTSTVHTSRGEDKASNVIEATPALVEAEGAEREVAEAFDLQALSPIALPRMPIKVDSNALTGLPIEADDLDQEQKRDPREEEIPTTAVGVKAQAQASMEEGEFATPALEDESDLEDDLQDGLPDIFEAALETQETAESEATIPSLTPEKTQGDKVDELHEMLPKVLLIDQEDDYDDCTFYFSD